MRVVVLILVLSIWNLMATAAAGQPSPVNGELEVQPVEVRMDLFYSGAEIDVRAELPAGYEGAVVRLMGRNEKLDLKKKGKKAAVLWMSVGDVVFENVPTVYHLMTSAPLADLADAAALARWRLGYDALLDHSGEDAALNTELVKLKESGGLFSVREGALNSQPADENAHRGPAVLLHGSFQLPARVPAGDYVVDLIGFKNRQGSQLASKEVRLEFAGAAQALRTLAFQHGLFYGLAAVVVAIVVGLLTGLLFDRKGEEAH